MVILFYFILSILDIIQWYPFSYYLSPIAILLLGASNDIFDL